MGKDFKLQHSLVVMVRVRFLNQTDHLNSPSRQIVKERDSARGERNEARQRCIHILKDYDGRKQAWQNQLNVVKIRLEHYARRHDKVSYLIGVTFTNLNHYDSLVNTGIVACGF